MNETLDLTPLGDGNCPVDGCGYDGNDTDDPLRSVWNHAKNRRDDKHLTLVDETSLAEWRSRVDGAETEETDEGTDDPGDPGERPGPNGETGHLGEAEEDEEDMVSPQEYETQQNGDVEPVDDEDEESSSSTSTSTSTKGATFMDVSGKWLMYGLVALLVVFVIWKFFSGRSTQTVDADTGTSAETTEESSDSEGGSIMGSN